MLEYLYETPIVSVPEVRNLVQTTYPAANKLVGAMERHGILVQLTSQRRNRRFLYRDYTTLFNDEQDNAEMSS